VTTLCAGGVLVREGRLLLAKRAEHRAFYPGVWDVVGGHCEAGEAPLAALQRELGEELAVKATALEEIAVLEAGDLRLHLFLVTAWEGEPRLANAEHTELRWCTLQEAVTLRLAHPSYPELLRAALERARGL
jgi:8-oxo-dGTP diphosphatase